ncbi:MAG: deoxyguanosinetriphosphate triphosphohydrolase [Corynebacterium sp.]|nr:deoxyguanosinetriphosphate triphosphohydrolase [Corynebacterium sp.]
MQAYQYDFVDFERRVPDAPKAGSMEGTQSDGRSPFSHDRDRVLHSAAFRRLADKTQVVGPGQGDIPRTRLTHSLEVGQIASGIGSGLGLNPSLCELAGLTHDIGHPPFGHNGETALNELADKCGGFEGNAQTLRILTRLEPKVMVEGPRGPESMGLNLTRASLDAACKYPWVKTQPDGSVKQKYSCYDEDKEIFEWIRGGISDSARPPMEGQVMDWSDDIAYSVHDVEDGILSGRIKLDVLWDLIELAEIAEKGIERFGGTVDEYAEAAGRLNLLKPVGAVQNFDGSLRSMVALKAMTSELVGRFVSATLTATREGNPDIILGRHHGQLIIPPEALAEVRLLKTLAVLYVINEPSHQRHMERQRDRIATVYDYLERGAPGTLDPIFAAWYQAAESEAEAQRVIIDQVASLTESRIARIAHEAAGNIAPYS